MNKYLSLSLLVALILFVGCGDASHESITGKVVFQGQENFAFAGDVLELRSQSDPNSHAFAELNADGSFEVDSLHDGKITRGAKPGEYDARIVIADDDAEHKQKANKAINKRYLSFETSGLKVIVPSSQVTLEISK